MTSKVSKKTLQAITEKGGKATKRIVKEKAKPAVDPLIEKVAKLSASMAAMEKDNKKLDELSKLVVSLRKDNDNLAAKVSTLQESNDVLSNNVAALLMRGRIKKVDVVRGKKIEGTNFAPIDSVKYEYEELH